MQSNMADVKMMAIVFVSALCLSVQFGQAMTTRQVAGGIEAIRLVGGGGAWEGRLEVQIQGQWGTVCNHFFDGYAVSVVCRMLGFQNNWPQIVSQQFGRGDAATPILLDGANCHGNELTLNACNWTPIGQHTCQHDQDVGLSCGSS